MKLLHSFFAAPLLLLLASAALAAEIELVPLSQITASGEELAYLQRFQNLNYQDVWHDLVEIHLVRLVPGLDPTTTHQKFLELRKELELRITGDDQLEPIAQKLTNSLSVEGHFATEAVKAAKDDYDEQTKDVVPELKHYNDHHEMNLVLELILSQGASEGKAQLVRNAVKKARWNIHLEKDQSNQDELKRYDVGEQLPETSSLLPLLGLALDDDQHMTQVLRVELKSLKIKEGKIQQAMQQARRTVNVETAIKAKMFHAARKYLEDGGSLEKTRVTQLIKDRKCYEHPYLVMKLLMENGSPTDFELALELSVFHILFRGLWEHEDIPGQWELLEYILLNHEPRSNLTRIAALALDSQYMPLLRTLKNSGKVADKGLAQRLDYYLTYRVPYVKYI